MKKVSGSAFIRRSRRSKPTRRASVSPSSRRRARSLPRTLKAGVP